MDLPCQTTTLDLQPLRYLAGEAGGVRKAEIPVERTNGPVFLISGDADQV
jgi:hypothetical protein